MRTLEGQVELSTLDGNRTLSPQPRRPVAYLARRDATIVAGGSSVSVAQGSVFRMLDDSFNPLLLSSWEIVDREEDTATRSILMGYGRRGVFNVPSWNAVRIEQTEDWPDHGHVGIQCLEDEPVAESVINAQAVSVFLRGEGYSFTSQGTATLAITVVPTKRQPKCGSRSRRWPA